MFNNNKIYSPASVNPFAKSHPSLNSQPHDLGSKQSKPFQSPSYQQFYTPRSHLGFSNKKLDTSVIGNPTNKFLPKPAADQSIFGTSFSKDVSFQNKNKKRTFHEMDSSYPQKDHTPEPAFQAPSHLEDNSTLKPGQQTEVRNPTLSMNCISSIHHGQIVDEYNRKTQQSQLRLMNFNDSKSPFIYKKDLFYDANEASFDDHSENDSDFQSVIDQQSQEKAKQVIITEIEEHNLKPEEIKRACQNITAIINEMSMEEANQANTDIANVNSKGEKYEYQPFQFLASTTYKIPLSLQKEIHQAHQVQDPARPSYYSFGLLSSVSLAYFIVNKTLYIWSYTCNQQVETISVSLNRAVGSTLLKQDFEQIVTHVALVSNLPEMKKKLENDEKLLIVATVIDIRVFILKKGEYDVKVQLFETDLVTPSEKNQINKIVQFHKNGRIFYGGADGHVYELHLDNGRLGLLSLFSSENKKLKKNDLMEESVFLKLIPSFLKLTDRKMIKDIKIDEQRNVMFTLCNALESDTQGQAIIEIFDLGINAKQFKRIVSIRQYELVKAIHTYMNVNSYLQGKNLFEMTEQFQIIFISPIQYSESQRHHLLLVTQNSLRIYISFHTKHEVDTKNEDEYPRDILINERFTSKWEISEIMNFPNSESAMDIGKYQLQEGVFKVHTLNHFATHVPLESESMFYNNFYSYLVYGMSINSEKVFQGRGQFVEDEDERPFIKLNFIKKNESAQAHYKYLQHLMKAVKTPLEYPTGGTMRFNLLESFSLINIPMDDHTQLQRGRQQMQYFNRLQHASELDIDDVSFQQVMQGKEEILQIGNAPTTLNKEVQQLLGMKELGFSSTRDSSEGSFGSFVYKYLSLSEMEKQVYIPPQKLNILTDQRIIEVIQLRPIDWLAIILNNMANSLTDSGTQPYWDLEDFIEQFSIKEVCSMMIQILAEQNNSYIFSKKIDDLLNQPKKLTRQSQSQPRQNMQFYSGSYMGQAYTPNVQRKTNFKPSQSQISTSYLANKQQEYASKEFVYRTPSEQMRQITLEMLQVYGETYPVDIEAITQRYLEDEAQLIPLSIDLISYKHQGLYQYLQRILRPIMNQPLFVSSNRYGNIGLRVQPSFESYDAPKMKLRGIIDLINTQMTFFYYSQDQKVKRQLSQQFKRKHSIQSQALLSQINYFNEIKSNQVQDQVEIQEKQSFLSLKVFIQRCLEALDLLDLTTYEGDQTKFNQLQNYLTQDQLYCLQDLTFNHILNGSSNVLIRRLLDASLAYSQHLLEEQARTGGPTSHQDKEFIKKRANRVRNLCTGIFSEDENRHFVGESLLKAAIKEPDVRRKEDLVKQAMDQITRDPAKIDLVSLVPILVESGNYTTIVDLSLRKAKKLQELRAEIQVPIDEDQPNEILDGLDECYGIVLSLFGAIDGAVKNIKDQNILESLLNRRSKGKTFTQYHMSFGKDSFLIMFMDKFREISRPEQKLALRSRISKRIEAYQDDILNSTIFDYKIKHPAEAIDFESVPLIKDELFKVICSDIAQRPEIGRDEFDNMVKIMIRRNEFESAANLVLQVVEGSVKITQSHGRGSLNCQEKLQNIELVKQACELKQQEFNSPKFNDIMETLRRHQSGLQNQLVILKYVSEKREGVHKHLKSIENELSLLQRKKKANNQNHELDEERKAIQNDFNVLTRCEAELNSFCFNGKQLTENYTHSIKVFAAYMYILINRPYLVRFAEEGRQIQTLRTAANDHFNDTCYFYKNTWQQELTKLLSDLFVKPKPEYLKTVLKEFSILNSRISKPPNEFLKDLEQVKKGLNLKATRYWLFYYSFESPQIMLQPSELVSTFSSIPLDQDLSLDLQGAPFIQNIFQFFDMLVLLILWCRKNNELFATNQTISENVLEKSPKMKEQNGFYEDLKRTGPFIWNKIVNGELETFLKQNWLCLEKQLSEMMKELMERVKFEVERMCRQHKVLDANNESMRESRRVEQVRSSLRSQSLILPRSSISQQAQNNSQVLGEASGFGLQSQKTSIVQPNRLRGTSAFKGRKQYEKNKQDLSDQIVSQRGLSVEARNGMDGEAEVKDEDIVDNTFNFEDIKRERQQQQ